MHNENDRIITSVLTKPKDTPSPSRDVIREFVSRKAHELVDNPKDSDIDKKTDELVDKAQGLYRYYSLKLKPRMARRKVNTDCGMKIF